MGVRSYAAIGIAQLAGKTSRLLGRGQGAMIGGLLALKIEPRIISQLAHDKTSIIITGTNGKSTTTRMIAHALATQGSVATQYNGANMDAGIAACLITHRQAHYAAIEIDELHVPHIGAMMHPQVNVLLNLSRDQLDRYGELGAVEKALRAYLSSTTGSVVANCDDVLVTSAAWNARQVVWVAAGSSWKSDAISCPRTGEPICHDTEHWYSTGDTTFARPEPHWWYDDNNLYHKDGFSAPLNIAVPGTINRANAVMAIAAAVCAGVPIAQAIQGVSQVTEIAGRYKIIQLGTHQVRLLLAKNPAGWHESLTILAQSQPAGIIISVNGKIQDGQDLSWLWDVDFDQLSSSAQPIICTGERAYDLATRLAYTKVDYRVEPDLLKAISALPSGRIDVLANYTAFYTAHTLLDSATPYQQSA